MKKFKMLMICCALLLFMTVSVSAETVVSIRVADEADLLMDDEEDVLIQKVNEIGARQDFDIAVVTVNSLEGKSAAAYADDYYDTHGYGPDGALLLVSMEDRDWYVTTSGYGITAITDAGLAYMSERFVPYLSDGDYLEAFMVYADLCDEFVTQAKAGEAYDTGNLPERQRSPMEIVVALVIGFVLAFIPMLIMRSKMKNVQKQSMAGDYVDHNSIAITERRDRFLYDTVTKTPIPKSSSGSSTHRSSSGRSHGGGGGKF